ncbi:MAG: hypothetical protein ETSY2_32440, partial [Candidatus Entotheonella gemina]
MIYRFGAYELDTERHELRHAGSLCQPEPQVFRLLAYLIEHRSRLVTKQELLDSLWPNHYISDATLHSRLRAVRHTLGDSGRTQSCIKTVHGRGYRFIAPVTTARWTTMPDNGAWRPALSSASVPGAPFLTPASDLLVGREAALAQLHQWFAAARRGERQIGFVSGEAGIGKTLLVNAFVSQLATTETVRIGHGYCIDSYGVGEPYLPWLEALGQLCRSPEGAELIEHLWRQAPSWLLQMPALLSASELETLQRRSGNTTRDRMLRELADVIESLTVRQPLVLVLEDLHWSDAATLAGLVYIARRQAGAHLFILGTYRPVDPHVRAHPLRTLTQELQRQGHSMELVLKPLPQTGVAAYIARRFEGAPLPPKLDQVIYERTEGHPLFMVTVVEDLLRQQVLQKAREGWVLHGGLEAVAVPESIRQLIEQQLEQLSPEDQSMLEVAGVAGMTFSAALVASGLDQSVEAVEARCAMLARREQFLLSCGTVEWPDETIATRYSFRHTLYREVLYDRVPASRRARLHQQLGMRLEAGYGPQVGDMAAKLADHFVRGRDWRRAVLYLGQTGENALRCSAHHEAIGYLTQGLDLLQRLPETSERNQHELHLQTVLASALATAKGQIVPEVERAYARAHVLCTHVGTTTDLFPILMGLRRFYLGRGALQRAQGLGEQLLSLAQDTRDAAFLLQASLALGGAYYHQGDLTAARKYLEQATRLYDPEQHRSHTILYHREPGVSSHCAMADVLWLLGYPDQARMRCREALVLGRELGHPYSLANALFFATLSS